MIGYFLLSRSIFESAIWKESPDVLKLFIYFLGIARFNKAPEQFPSFEVVRGDILTSLRDISEDNIYIENNRVKRWSISKVSRMINKLEKSGYIKQYRDTFGTHLNVCNYDLYQNKESYASNAYETLTKQQQDSYAKAVQKPCKGYAKAMQTPKKVNNVKKEKNVNKDNKDNNKEDKDFDIAWKAYERKGVKQNSKKAWLKLSDSQKNDVVKSIDKYFLENPDKQFRKDFERYISHSVYESVLDRFDNDILNIPQPSLGSNQLTKSGLIPPTPRGGCHGLIVPEINNNKKVSDNKSVSFMD